MSKEVCSHRMGAYVYGFLSGIGLTMLTWGVTWVAWSPTRNLPMFIALTLFGVSLLAFGGCREAYLRGSLSVPVTSAADKNQDHSVVTGTQELVLCEQEQPNKA